MLPRTGELSVNSVAGQEKKSCLCGDRVVSEPTFSTSLKNLTSLDTRASLIKLRIRTNISILIILLVLEGLSSLWYCKSWNNKTQSYLSFFHYNNFVECTF